MLETIYISENTEIRTSRIVLSQKAITVPSEILKIYYLFDRENKQLVASMNVQLDKAAVEKGRALSDDTQGNDGNVYKILQESVQSGKIGNLKVDPKYLVFEPVSSKYLSI